MAFGRLLESRRGPFGELQREIQGLFDSLMPRFGSGLFAPAFPPINIYEDHDALVVECEAPGIDEEKLDLTVTGDVLTIKGERPAIEACDDTRVHIHERGYGVFNRAVTLPSNIDSEQVEARYENGVLSIRLPKAPEAKPRQVTVQVE
jgi:HSP20 family protein